MTSSLLDKVAIITGASSGLGVEIAVKMAEKGAWLTLCGRDADRLESVLQRCECVNGGKPERLLAVTGDVTSRDCRKRIVSETVAKFGRVDILVPNAGVTFPGLTIEEATEDLYDKVMETNLKSVFFLIQEATPHLQESKGVVVCMSSLFGTVPTAASTVYAMAKAGMDHMVRCLCLSLGPKGIRINAVKPSYIPTEITRNYANHDKIPPIHAKNESPFHPFEGRCCTEAEIAEVVMFLASSASSFVTGECMHVDGGRRFFPGDRK